eukprot:CAMPEP_0206036840 /NCGR_PEP_ID=MMETSP1466-20131121/3057_1 /ASSEMBLY_ACC=CAM_ASM_001126 /TAXON_ID=44452 /ORGANISM="Pavlova gyrans, Strain CCMP608" /LENGTH=52 /DNA_ID=CAMNT_0053411355 /DNA_START=37 /DNA_END=192 /DNA_ORIENTATION=-
MAGGGQEQHAEHDAVCQHEDTRGCRTTPRTRWSAAPPMQTLTSLLGRQCPRF